MHHSRLCAVLIDCKTADVDEAARFWAAAPGRPVDLDHPSRDNYRMLATPTDEPIVEIQRVALGQLHQLLDRAMGEPGVGRMRDRLLLHSGIYRNPFEIFGAGLEDRPRALPCDAHHERWQRWPAARAARAVRAIFARGGLTTLWRS